MRVLSIVVAAALAAALTGCGGDRGAERAQESPGGGKRLSIATGNTTGVYYILGGGLADLISKNLPGYEATAEATGASVENIQRVVKGDSDIGFSLADSAADAVQGKGAFTSPQPIRAIARLYNNYTQVVATADSGIKSIADLKGKRVSTGSPNSGTEVIALRLLKAAGLDPDKDVTRQALGLPESVDAMKSGGLDALIWSGGLPTPGITDLTTNLKEDAVFVPLADVLPKLQAEHGQVYAAGTIGKDVYQAPADVDTVVVPNLLVVNESMDPALAESITKLIFDHKADLVAVSKAASEISKETAPKTEPVQLHDGSKKYFGG
ncbi:TAXI family TRAP transporter solute-binding subunit [Nonomuraea africana]|uniref:TRAP transporter TAXI family solute receptor n=1 Tax=Nonomuraea africana TaxID=46171 RepID=A0ABR9KHB8_9ACTN|nr:TAXI family TRAP transporter solute-binding subunit [Nonomuraea africana]MBE1561043.1 TRAP transporter TAXI family solute receptor [Nonomuraea africana]